MSQSINNDGNRIPQFRSIPFPPPPFFALADRESKVCNIVNSQKKFQKVEGDLKDLYRIIISALTGNKKAFTFIYKYLTPVLQDGPNCGLAALSMVSSCQEEILKLEDIFNFTKSKGFSNNGEMFSVHYMAEIAQALIGCDVNVLENGIQDKEAVFSEILAGGLLLIPHNTEVQMHYGLTSSISYPSTCLLWVALLGSIISGLGNSALVSCSYDADFNHSPCKKKGHRAHWAVVVGLIIEGIPPAETQGADEDVNTKVNCIQYLPDDGSFSVKYISKAYASDKIHMVARQGKSLHPAVWKYNELRDSNENLVEFDPSRANSEADYILPPEGVEGGLKGKAIILKGLPPATCDELSNYQGILKNLI